MVTVKRGEKYSMTLPLGTQVEIIIPGTGKGIIYVGEYLDGLVSLSLVSINGEAFDMLTTPLDMDPVEYLALRGTIENLVKPNIWQLEEVYQSIKLVEDAPVHVVTK
jgi:hypothetical protein